ncbi:uncharacterized protein ANIA_07765 [Aspergillus nidulans FGSC A4]|uniref:Transposase Tc1-like domain-containing protein n=1 Tax=Emericella nidulans (strain FGSC A4 / ATCC 38163 / CBS 112.46 / NRRL 194 / M139) TaxID=227321 RepID=C8VDN4_EMENI|nr:hypothetical protein [Aspergillus nidulans FGSC A4]CBF80063.1 TPA: conserved hypothetical protein [Aspergillus nidulans FGSC A4]
MNVQRLHTEDDAGIRYGSGVKLSHNSMSRRRKELTPDIRARLCELKAIGWKVTKIHKRYPDIPYSTIRSTIMRENARKNQQSCPRSGRPKKISPEEQQQLLGLVETDQHIKMRELSEAVQSGPSVRTVQRLLSTLQKKKQSNKHAGYIAERISSEVSGLDSARQSVGAGDQVLD